MSYIDLAIGCLVGVALMALLYCVDEFFQRRKRLKIFDDRMRKMDSRWERDDDESGDDK